MKLLALTLSALSLVALTLKTNDAHASTSKFRVNKEFPGEYSKKFAASVGELDNPLPPPTAFTFKQVIDHARPKSSPTFTQNYWVSPGYSTGENSPVILYMCGEAACSAKDVTYMLPWAQSIGAAVVVIEHRYYGASLPFAQNTTANLKWLTMPQALADFASIVRYLKTTQKMNGPWIATGGSYAGMLSSALRTQYPNLFTGAWSSSAPLKVEEDYQGYDAQMTADIGGQCADSLRKVVAFAEQSVANPADFAALRTRFLSDTLTDADDFLFGIVDVAAAAVQYRMTARLCDSFKTADPVEDYAAFLKDMADNIGYLTTSYSFATIMDTTAGSASSDGRAFVYQQCNEIGLFQTANSDVMKSVRSQRTNMDYMRKGCERAFGKRFVAETKSTQRRYFDPVIHGITTEVYYTNGSLDPWAPLGISIEAGTWTNKYVYAYTINGSSHTDDLSYKRKDKTPELNDAAAYVQLLMRKWSR